ncbi:hypothetical protein KEM52_000619, partial [Ascosphaera acerosa]
MAQALCGPSNALQNLTKQASADRSLQQDRAAPSASHAVSQDFRSRIPTDILAADAELAAFEAGVAPSPSPIAAQPQHPLARHHIPVPGHAHAHAIPPQAQPDWASDFQHLSISSPLRAQQFRQHHQPFQHLQQQRAPAQSSWQEEFLQQQQQQQSGPQHAASPASLASQRLFGTMGAMSPAAPFYDQSASSLGAVAPATASSTEAFDDEAFEAAFAEARAEIDQLERHQQPQSTSTQHGAAPDTTTQHETSSPRIGADTIADTPRDAHGANQSDDLARTAGQLLNSVQYETSQKFRESSFLALMRQLRDREVVVDGDEFKQ